MKTVLILLLSFVWISCEKKYEVPVPDTHWDLFESPSALPLSANSRQPMEGIYTITDGSDIFGNLTALKWSYTKNNSDTVFHLSAFCETDAAFFILEGKHLGDTILLNGSWRKEVNTEAGIVRFIILPEKGGQLLMNSSPQVGADSIVMEGTFGIGKDVPASKITLRYLRPLNDSGEFLMVAHRGGGRNDDKLPASENTVEIIRLASQLGAKGIEVDVHLTSDGVPILYHDETLNERLIIPNGMIGPITNYSYAQLHDLVRLVNGERIPTLDEALHTVVYETPLEFVWLDIKIKGSLQSVRDLQAQYLQEAAQLGRHLKILIGIPDDDVKNNFKLLPNYSSIPSLCEMFDKVSEVNSEIWGAPWALGLQEEELAQIHAAGRKAIAWTMDDPEFIKLYINEGHFDGILANRPTLVAFYYYAKQ
jgi:glycerophosphoryl diester phosphodiesterase